MSVSVDVSAWIAPPEWPRSAVCTRVAWPPSTEIALSPPAHPGCPPVLATSSTRQAVKQTSLPLTRIWPRRCMLEMCTGGAPLESVKMAVLADDDRWIAAPGSPISHTSLAAVELSKMMAESTPCSPAFSVTLRGMSANSLADSALTSSSPEDTLRLRRGGGGAGGWEGGGGDGGMGGGDGGGDIGGEGADGGKGGGYTRMVKLVWKGCALRFDHVQLVARAMAARSSPTLPDTTPAYAQFSLCAHSSASTPAVNPGGRAE
eukprot:166762-Prymnesium_polylepis.1